MKNLCLVLNLVFLLSSCDIKYDGETKLYLKGTIVDENKQPIVDKKIEVKIDDGGGFSAPFTDLISYGKSDKNGKFNLLFPSPLKDNKIAIEVNKAINETNGYTNTTTYIKKINFKNYTLDIGTVVLYKKSSVTDFTLLFNRTSLTKSIKDLKVEGKLANSIIDLNKTEDDQNYTTIYSVLKNQTINLKYTLIDNSNSSEVNTYSIPIKIDEKEVSYTITY